MIIFTTMNKELVAEQYQKLQDRICAALEDCDGKGKFEQELWEREGGGGGRTRIIQNGNVIEKGGVNFSAVHGALPETIKKAFNTADEEFYATGVSIVIHPNNPHVPIIHMNVRYFETFRADGAAGLSWFGGGIDLTPHYVLEEDARFFHNALKNTCDRYDKGFYPDFKNRADHYFYIKHRKETRGIGGIFYDRLNEANTGLTWGQLLDFSMDVGNTFAPAYTALMDKNREQPFTDAEQYWQYLRRSRYAEFNLVYDAGTKFGLETDGRIESILMSLPPTAKWAYNHVPEAGSKEEATLNLLRKGIDWV